MFSRAGLSRTVTLVVALSLTAVSTGAAARASGATVTKSAGAIDLDRSNGAMIGSEILVSFEPWGLAGPAFYDSGAKTAVKSGVRSISGNVRFEAAMAGSHAQAQRDLTMARLIERIRKVE